MDPTSDLDLQPPPAAPHERPGRPRAWAARVGRRAVLWLHRQAERLDLIPAEFGDETPVDPQDASALAREWLRQARLWASYNPEEMLALKAGAAALAVALVALVGLVAAIR